jgi:spore coat polysaccharide biosynthesis protein SpsF (cytidylyltransferase family)
MIGVIIQARTGSSRFPRKIYEDLSGKTTLYRVLEGVTKNKAPHQIVLAMPEYDGNEFVQKYNAGEFEGAVDDRFDMYFGHPEDLVDRYYRSANEFGIDHIVRITADCPFGGTMIDEMLFEYFKKGYNGFMGNNNLVSHNYYPNGTDVEIFPYWMLAETKDLTSDPVHREHVTPFMYRRGTEYKLHPFLNQRPNTMISTKFSDFSFDTDSDRRLLVRLTESYDKATGTMAERLNKAIKETHF